MPRSPSLLFRARVFLDLLFGLRRHDFRAARTFAEMQFADDSRLRRWGKLISWALRQMWCEIPEAMGQTTFDRPVAKDPIWLAEGNPLENHPWANDPGATLPQEAETVVIGSGLAGSALAYHWGKAEQNRLKMVVLEMGDAASGSAGRNEGLVVMGRYYHLVYKLMLPHLREVRAELTEPQVKQLAHQFATKYCTACYRNADMTEETIRAEGFDCDYAREGWVQTRDATEQAALSESVRMATEHGFRDWTSITPEEVERRCGMNVRHNAGYSLAAASLHPAKWCFSLLRSALNSGTVAFYSRTKVLRVEDAGEAYRVHTARGIVRARVVVNATESYTPLLHQQFRGIIRPTQTQAASGEGGPTTMKPHIGISSSEGFFGRHGNRVTVGSDATRVPDHEAGRIQPSRFLTKYVVSEMQKAFGPSAYHVTHEWSGTVTYTPDQYPVLGVFDGKRQYIIGGMAGSGTAVSFNGARCLVNRILGITDAQDDYPEAYFSPMRLLDPASHHWPEIEGRV